VVDKQDPNTYVIYLGDNGTWMFGEKREFIDNMYITRRGRSKGTAFESGARVSMAIRGPKIKAGSKSNEPIHGVDLFSTILQLASLEVPKTVPNKTGDAMIPVDGISLTPILFNGAKRLRDPDKGFLLTETVNPVMNNQRQAGARNAKYKVICTDKTDTASCAFYNLMEDPLEEYPLAKPDSCANYKNGTWTPADPKWHFCRLQEVLGKESFLAIQKNANGQAQTRRQLSPQAIAALAD
jgi:arylsulfatase A-like enzyme